MMVQILFDTTYALHVDVMKLSIYHCTMGLQMGTCVQPIALEANGELAKP